jgi:hypothetical protein
VLKSLLEKWQPRLSSSQPPLGILMVMILD